MKTKIALLLSVALMLSACSFNASQGQGKLTLNSKYKYTCEDFVTKAEAVMKKKNKDLKTINLILDIGTNAGCVEKEAYTKLEAYYQYIQNSQAQNEVAQVPVYDGVLVIHGVEGEPTSPRDRSVFPGANDTELGHVILTARDGDVHVDNFRWSLRSSFTGGVLNFNDIKMTEVGGQQRVIQGRPSGGTYYYDFPLDLAIAEGQSVTFSLSLDIADDFIRVYQRSLGRYLEYVSMTAFITSSPWSTDPLLSYQASDLEIEVNHPSLATFGLFAPRIINQENPGFQVTLANNSPQAGDHTQSTEDIVAIFDMHTALEDGVNWFPSSLKFKLFSNNELNTEALENMILRIDGENVPGSIYVHEVDANHAEVTFNPDVILLGSDFERVQILINSAEVINDRPGLDDLLTVEFAGFYGRGYDGLVDLSLRANTLAY